MVLSRKYLNRIINESLDDLFQDDLFNDVNDHFFSIETLKTMDWKNGDEIIRYCENCNLYKVGEGAGRVVFQIDDEKVIKIQKKTLSVARQNEREVQAFRSCTNEMKDFVANIYDYDKRNTYPLWVISEQVLQATYADFKKILGIDFGNYVSYADITQMNNDLQFYSRYDTASDSGFNLMEFLEAYGEGDIYQYLGEIKRNRWLGELLTILRQGIVAYWELENIENWGLVKRNGKPKLIILDIGI